MNKKEYRLRSLFWEKFGTKRSMRDVLKEKGIDYNSFLRFVKCKPIKDKTLWRISEVLQHPVRELVEMREDNESSK